MSKKKFSSPETNPRLPPPHPGCGIPVLPAPCMSSVIRGRTWKNELSWFCCHTFQRFVHVGMSLSPRHELRHPLVDGCCRFINFRPKKTNWISNMDHMVETTSMIHFYRFKPLVPQAEFLCLQSILHFVSITPLHQTLSLQPILPLQHSCVLRVD